MRDDTHRCHVQLLSITGPQTFHGDTAASDPKSAAYFFLSSFQQYLTWYLRFSNRQLLWLLNTACVCLCHEYIQMKGRIDPVAVLFLFSPCEGGRKLLHSTYWASLKEKLGVQRSEVAKCRRNGRQRRHALLTPPLWICQRFTGQ